jgi:hypothetical protein
VGYTKPWIWARIHWHEWVAHHTISVAAGASTQLEWALAVSRPNQRSPEIVYSTDCGSERQRQRLTQSHEGLHVACRLSFNARSKSACSVLAAADTTCAAGRACAEEASERGSTEPDPWSSDVLFSVLQNFLNKYVLLSSNVHAYRVHSLLLPQLSWFAPLTTHLSALTIKTSPSRQCRNCIAHMPAQYLFPCSSKSFFASSHVGMVSPSP